MNKNTSNISVVASLITTSLVVSYQANAATIYTETNLYTSLNTPLSIDINTDGFNDIKFHNTYSFSSYYRGSSSNYDLYADGLQGALITLGGPLSFGDLIDGSSDFGVNNHLADYNSSYSSGYRHCRRWRCHSHSGSSSKNTYGTWNDDFDSVSGFLGFSLLEDEETFYGWAEISMQATGATTIHGYAYESCAGAGILAGQQESSCQTENQASSVSEPSPIALLALGSIGIGMMKRRRIQNI